MKNSSMNSFRKLLVMVVGIWCLIVTEAQAYVDPGSGSVIVTTILGLFAAIGYTFRKYFYKIKRLISGEKTKEKTTGENSD